MDVQIRRALEHDRTIDITTTGRRSGQPRRIEIWFYRVDGAIYLTGSPGRRDWYANLLSDSRFTFHLKNSVHADLAAIARPITDRAERRRIMRPIVRAYASGDTIERWIKESPLVEVEFLESDTESAS